MEGLSKQERKELAKQERQNELAKEERKEQLKKYRFWIIVVLLFGGGLYWMYQSLTKPLPGERIEDLGRDHVNDIAEVTYNSDPPTSGSHFPVWAKKGVYDRLISDGYLIHSLEHGYIVISYNCDASVSSLPWMSMVNAQEAEETPTPEEEESALSGKPLTKMTVIPSETRSWVTPEDPPGIEVDLPESFQSDSCKELVTKLSEFPQEWERVVVVPRLNMETPIALTAWRRIEKLDSFDTNTIERFIETYHNQGPEKTME